MSESIADILREMRAWTVDTDGLAPEEVSLNVSAFADRIEAAYKREVVTDCNGLNTNPAENVNNEKVVYNGARMVEVLKSASERLRKATESEKFGEDVLYLVGCMRSVAQELQYGLAEPPRNCDEYSDFNAAIRRFAKERPNESGKWDMARYAQFAQWLFAKVKGEADEQ